MFIHSKSYSYWPIFLAILILTISCGILFGGVNQMVRYGNATGKKFDYDLVSLHFFVREYLTQQYQKFTVEDLSKSTVLPSFQLFVDEKDLESLEENLPASAKLQFKRSHIKVDEPAFSNEAQFRYRGGLDLHWLYKKKSIRVKLPPFVTYRNERRFNLVNPSTIHTITDWLSYDMASSIGLLTPEYFPARVFINNETNGLHFFLSETDESFLRKNNRMPGSIYSGDTKYFVNPYINESPIEEISYKVDGSIYGIWKDERLWEKNASRNMESSGKREDIEMFIKILNKEDPLEFMQEFDNYFDKEKFYLYWGLDNLVGSYHHDLFHNHKIYFDPYKGKFEPIEWDLRFWSNIMIMPVTPLFKQVLLNPILKYEVDLAIYKLWKQFTVEDVLEKIDKASNVIAGELAADPYRIHPYINNKHFGNDKAIPFSMNEYFEAIKDLKQKYKVRHRDTEQLLNSISAEYSSEQISENQIKISLVIRGNSPLDFDPWSMIPDPSDESVKMFRIYEDKIYPILKNGKLDRLYPGITMDEQSGQNQFRRKNVLKYRPGHYVSTPLYYRYLIKGLSGSNLISSNNLSGRNSITSKVVTIEHVENLSDNDKTTLLHPWKLLTQANTMKNTIVLSGEIDVSQDLVFSGKQRIIIEPGTVFKISKNTSIYFYGKVIAKGTSDALIKFEAKELGQAWGSIVIQGKKASGSILSHFEVNGGSIAARNLIHYPGQLNIHDVDSFQLEHCYIYNNSIGDDALHVAYSQGEIKHCDFKNTAFDALDMDIVDVTVSNSTFYNIGNDAIDLMNSKATISNVDINGTGDKCISVGEASEVTIKSSQLKNCMMGIAVKDQSIAHVEDIDFSIKEGNAISLYRKNPRYSTGGEISGGRLYGITSKDIAVGDYSVNKIHKDAYIPTRDQQHKFNENK